MSDKVVQVNAYWSREFKPIQEAAALPTYEDRSARLALAVAKLERLNWPSSPLRAVVGPSEFADDHASAISLGNWFIGVSESQAGNYRQAYPFFQKAHAEMLVNKGMNAYLREPMKGGRYSPNWVYQQSQSIDYSLGFLNACIRTDDWKTAERLLKELDGRFGLIGNERGFYRRHSNVGFGFKHVLYLNSKGLFLTHTSQLGLAREAFGRAHEEALAMGDRRSAAAASSNIGDTYYLKAQWLAARPYYRRALFEEPDQVPPSPDLELSRKRDRIFRRLGVIAEKLSSSQSWDK